ncbi:MAG: hypothetical protein INQ03_09375 [Candidatus Heimdallarchaeota archaeon]|nr:hypothetical protein [Candidatus Heimdallarchaeota archaeon]
MRIRITIFLLFLFFNVPNAVFTSAQDDITDIKEEGSSIILQKEIGRISNYFINSKGSYLVWEDQFFNKYYDKVEIIDLDSDGSREILGLSPNEELLILNFDNGSVIERVPLNHTSVVSTQLIIADVMGTSNLEIIISNLVSSDFHNSNQILVFHSNGTLATKIDQIVSPFAISGADNIISANLDNDSNQELLLSYGSGQWNVSSRTAENHIIALNYNSTSNKFDRLWHRKNTDEGGDFRILVINPNTTAPIIATTGWYNNYIRAFDRNGVELWKRQLANTSNIENYAEPNLASFREDNTTHLLVFQQSYSGDHPLYWYDLDLLSGENLRGAIRFNQTFNMAPYISIDTIHLARYTREGNSGAYGWIIEEYSLINLNLKSSIILHNNKLFLNYKQMGYSPLYMEFNRNPSLIYQDDQGEIFFEYNKQQFSITGKGVVISPIITSINRVILPSGDLMVNYFSTLNDEREFGELFIGFIAITIILSIMLGYIFLKRDKITKKDTIKDELVLVVYRLLSQIFQNHAEDRRITETEDTIILSEPLNYESGVTKSLSIQSEEPEKFNEPLENNITCLSKWVNDHDKISKKMKMGDLIMLIEFLEAYPSALIASTLQKQYIYISKATFYSRINFLIEMDLLENISSVELDNRYLKLILSQVGYKFMLDFYIFLNRQFS